MDVFEKASRFTQAREAISAGLYPYFLPMEGNEGSETVLGGERIIMCGSNNYLGLTTHPRVREAAIEATRVYGTSCTGSRFLNGTLELHLELERQLAEWVGKESALVFSTGMQANLGTISALVGRGDVVVLDKGDHASLVDGARLGWGRVARFRHQDIDDLKHVLAEIPSDHGILVAVDGLYSMEGDIAPLPAIIEAAAEHDARVLVDDAHAIGVLGGGRGTAAHFGVTDEVDLIVGTFSKSFASLGGFVAGDEDVIHYVQHHARTLIFSASIPAANAAAALAALEVMKTEPERIDRLHANAAKMREGLRALGYDIGDTETPIVPVVIGDETTTLLAWKWLLEHGVYVNPVLPPATVPGRELLRTSYMATHTDEQLDQVLEAFEVLRDEMNLVALSAS